MFWVSCLLLTVDLPFFEAFTTTEWSKNAAATASIVISTTAFIPKSASISFKWASFSSKIREVKLMAKSAATVCFVSFKITRLRGFEGPRAAETDPYGDLEEYCENYHIPYYLFIGSLIAAGVLMLGKSIC